MFLDGLTYPVKQATQAQQAAFQRLLSHQAEMFLLLEADHTLESVRWLVAQLVPELEPSKVTETNRREIFRAIRLAQQDQDRAAIVDTRDARKWEEEHGSP